MTEVEWFSDSPLCSKIDFLEAQVGNHRRLRLFACACCRRAWNLLRLADSRKTIDLAEAYADRQATITELQAASAFVDFAYLQAQYEGRSEAELQLSICELKAMQAVRELSQATFDTYLIAQDTSRTLARDFIPDLDNQPGRSVFVDVVELAEKAKLLHDIFYNPFHSFIFSPMWRTSTALILANQMYESRDFSTMPILADALQDSGCSDPVILNHCRSDSPHVKGCWVVDLLLSKV